MSELRSGDFFACQQFVFSFQFFLGFHVVVILRDTINRTYQLALGLIVVANALGAFCGFNFVNFFARRNRFVRALRFTYIAIDALISNNKSHDIPPSGANCCNSRLCLHALLQGFSNFRMHEVADITA